MKLGKILKGKIISAMKIKLQGAQWRIDLNGNLVKGIFKIAKRKTI